ncbi:TPA: hypothetical protein U2L25_004629 [Burkholderia multivorans]|nr:hypothetical protein [Burkholderia multivorans]HEM7822398.1 hypothetical protein [Burkholderia multivorans]
MTQLARPSAASETARLARAMRGTGRFFARVGGMHHSAHLSRMNGEFRKETYSQRDRRDFP